MTADVWPRSLAPGKRGRATAALVNRLFVAAFRVYDVFGSTFSTHCATMLTRETAAMEMIQELILLALEFPHNYT